MSKSVDTDLPVLQAIKDRWSPRAFDPKPIPEIELQAMLEALRWSSSCFNEQPWQLLITHRGVVCLREIAVGLNRLLF